MSNLRHPFLLALQPEGGFTVTLPDIPEAIAEGDDRDAALVNAVEVLSVSARGGITAVSGFHETGNDANRLSPKA